MHISGRQHYWIVIILIFILAAATGCSASTSTTTDATTPTAIATMAAAAPAATPAPTDTPASTTGEATDSESADSESADSEATASEATASEVVTATESITQTDEVVSETVTLTESVDATAPITPTETVTSSTSAVPAEDAPKLTLAPWTLDTVNGIPVLESLAVSALFGTDGMLTGDTGCNDYSATYTVTGDENEGQIAITDVTKLAQNSCRSDEAATQEEEYLQRLPLMTTYTNDDFLLELCNADGSDCIQFVSDISQVLDRTEWIAFAYQNGMGELTGIIPSEPPITVLFADGRVKGYAGCAYFEGGFDRTDDSVTISDIKFTAASSETTDCDPQLHNQQVLYLEALEKANSYDARLGSLTLLDESGNALVAYGVFSVSPPVE